MSIESRKKAEWDTSAMSTLLLLLFLTLYNRFENIPLSSCRLWNNIFNNNEKKTAQIQSTLLLRIKYSHAQNNGCKKLVILLFICLNLLIGEWDRKNVGHTLSHRHRILFLEMLNQFIEEIFIRQTITKILTLNWLSYLVKLNKFTNF